MYVYIPAKSLYRSGIKDVYLDASLKEKTCSLKWVFVHLIESQSNRRNSVKESSPIHWFTPLMATIARTEPDQSNELHLGLPGG